jgi:hypothetical protein
MALASWHESQASAESAAAADVARPRVGFVLVDATAGPSAAPAATTFGSTAADATAIRREARRRLLSALWMSRRWSAVSIPNGAGFIRAVLR